MDSDTTGINMPSQLTGPLDDHFLCLRETKAPIAWDTYSLQEAMEYPSVGILMPKPYVVVDIDNMAQGEKLLQLVTEENIKCQIMKTTRGFHFWFASPEIIKNSVATMTGLGIHADYRSWGKKSEVCIRFKGQWREWLTDYDWGELCEIPRWLKPLKQDKWKFYEMGEGDGRNQALFDYQIMLSKRGYSKDAAFEVLRLINTYIFEEPMLDSEIKTICRDEAYPKPTPVFSLDTGFSGEAPPGIEIIDMLSYPERYSLNDIGIGQWVADCLKGVARYCPQAAEWYTYDQRRWVVDTGSLRMAELAKFLARQLPTFAPKIEDDTSRAVFLKYTARLGVLRERQNLLSSAKSVYPVDITEFDTNPYFFNCANGTFNLHTFQLQEHNPSDLITKVASVDYNPDARSSRWEEFVKEIMSGDAEKTKSLHTAIGYAMTGLHKEKCVFMLNGPGANNGKSVFTSAILRAFGDYGTAAQADVVVLNSQGRSTSGPTEDLARLHGSRFVSIAEPDKSARLNAGLVKQISGAGDPLNARFLHQNSFTFIPSFKLFIHCNGLPRVSDDTLFSSGRVRVIPFDRSFSPEEQDKSLSTFFERSENLSSILNWCIEGARLYFQNGLHESLVVHAATSKYRLDNDPVQLYLNECFDVEGDGQTSLRILRDSYSVWCGENGFKPFARTGFIKELEVHGISIKGIHNHQTGVAGRLYQQGVPYSARTLAN